MPVCLECGKENLDGTERCAYCGRTILMAGLSQSASESEPTGSMNQVQESKKWLLWTLARTREDDAPISVYWAALNAFFIGGYAVLFLAYMPWLRFEVWNDGFDVYLLVFLIVRPLLWTVFGVLLGLLFYKMLVRMNRHIAHEEQARASAISYVRACASARGEEPRLMNELLNLSAFDGQARTYDRQLSPARWGLGIAVLFAIGTLGTVAVYLPLFTDQYWGYTGLWFFIMVIGSGSSIASLLAVVLSFYVASVLMKTMYTHDFRWASFSNSTVVVLRKLGFTLHTGPVYPSRRERSFGKYLVLTVITFGLFGFYWLYAMIVDQNRHFADQLRFENELARELSP